jgi:hypothetical protein
VYTIRDLEDRLAVARAPLRLAIDACERFPGFSRTVFVTRSNRVVIEYGVLGGQEGTLRIWAEFSNRSDALMQGLLAANRDVSSVREEAVVDQDWLPQFPDDFDLETSEVMLSESLARRDVDLFPSDRYASFEDRYWVGSNQEFP